MTRTAVPRPAGDAGAGLRTFVARHEVASELAFAGLAVAFVSLAALPEDTPWLPGVELAITAIFAAEFLARLAVAPDRGAYVRGHWIDVVALVPPIRGLRILRLLRLLRLLRAFAGVARALTSIERLAEHRGLIWLLTAWIAVMLLTSIGLYLAEVGVNEAVTSPLDALWWGITTMTTVGYGDVYPVTLEGRIAAAILMLLGIGLFSAITAIGTSFLLEGRRPKDDLAELERAADLHDRGVLTSEEFETLKAIILERRRTES